MSFKHGSRYFFVLFWKVMKIWKILTTGGLGGDPCHLRPDSGSDLFFKMMKIWKILTTVTHC